jgi:TRAP-type C4-dicarboxylate transport system permease small subunit
MKEPARRLLFWSPRVLCIAFALFVSLFALDVSNEGLGLRKTIPALSIQTIPTAFVVLVLALSWRWEWVGGILYIAAGIGYLSEARHHPAWVVVISGPLFLVGALFLLNWLKRAEIRAKQGIPASGM